MGIKVKKLKQQIEESTQLQSQLQTILEDMVQFITISQSLLLQGSSALVTHVKRLKALKVQKEVELDQYCYICNELNEKVLLKGLDLQKTEKEEEVDDDNEDEKKMIDMIDELSIQLE